MTQIDQQQQAQTPALLRRFMPLIIFALILIFLGVGMTLNPRQIPSNLLNKPVPHFELPLLYQPDVKVTQDELMREGIVVVNFFASWCAPCRVEHESLKTLSKRQDVTLYGMSYKDKASHAKAFLEQLGDPYDGVIVDARGRTAIDFGLTGPPETFIIKDGIIKHQHIGPIHPWELEDKIISIIEEIKRAPSQP